MDLLRLHLNSGENFLKEYQSQNCLIKVTETLLKQSTELLNLVPKDILEIKVLPLSGKKIIAIKSTNVILLSCCAVYKEHFIITPVPLGNMCCVTSNVPLKLLRRWEQRLKR